MADEPDRAPGSPGPTAPHPRSPEGAAPFLPDAWWRLSLLRRREIALAVVALAVLAVGGGLFLVLRDPGSGSTDAEASPSATTAAAGTTATTVTDVDPDTYVASMSPQRVETFNSLAGCESSGNWSEDSGNGFYGGLQFTLESWQAVGGSGNPASTSQNEQIMRGSLLQARQGWVAWPACASQLGLT
ncbi:MAG: transglycosylase family protein [Acidimicrobiales bacterium]|nr:transglycosylase family protein [Acidimicrobiales bacterium]